MPDALHALPLTARPHAALPHRHRARAGAPGRTRTGGLVLLMLMAAAAHADGRRERAAVAPLPLYAQECGACHVPYAPALLPPAAWTRVMQGLDRHYGTEASLAAGDAERLTAWLLANAGGRRQDAAPPAEDRITRTGWFLREHRRIDADTWRLPSVRSAANCEACHGGAARGDFDEHALRMPAGLSPRQRATWND